MPKELLTGTLDEQCEFLYNLAQEKMAQGNYTGAVHALKEVVKYAPDYRNAAALLAVAQERKAMHTRLLWFGLGGAALLIGAGTLLLQIRNDLVLLVLAVVGALLGYWVGNIYQLRRQAANDDDSGEGANTDIAGMQGTSPDAPTTETPTTKADTSGIHNS